MEKVNKRQINWIDKNNKMTQIPTLLCMTSPSVPYEIGLTEKHLNELEADHFNGQLNRKDLLQFLIAIQQRFGWICKDAIAWCSHRISQLETGISEQEIRGIIDFYSFLEKEACPPLHLHLSTNVTDYMLGQQDHQAYFETLAKEYPKRFRVTNTSCTGLCDQGPAALLNGLPIPALNNSIREAIRKLVEEQPAKIDVAATFPTPQDNIQLKDQLLNRQLQSGNAIKRVMTNPAEGFLGELNAARLRGRGGAGFPTGFKWQTCADADASQKVVVCNADEGEPGTFKDRVLLHSHIQQVIEGMTIAARTVGASLGFIYLRFEYQYLLPMLTAAIEERVTQNLLGDAILGEEDFNFHLHIHLGAGAYICGEESALLESLEGKRGIPRIRPPFPAQAGYLGYPTIVNNVETFCCVAEVALTGGANFASRQCEGSTGTKIHSISGDCERPGIYELPFDTTVEDILKLVGAKNTQAVQVGGPSGKLLFPELFHEPVNFSHVSSGGSFMVFDESRDLFNVVKNFTDFFHHESCGFCTPCRVGCGVLSETLDKFAKHHASDDDIQHLREMMELMDVASHCGLGQTAAHPVRFLLEGKPDFFKNKETTDSVVKIDIHEETSAARELHLANAGESHE
ncbi:MAG: NAD(P)H-dependent oxidoreductase subunit E [Pseudomonadales bacterium]|nr:NAD(P)H-dependent oxidoreductase subunit E [Pseudomonadales bacterium]